MTGRGNKRPAAVSKLEYDTLVALVEGNFSVPVAERSKKVNAAVRKFYRNFESYTLRGNPPVLHRG